MQTIVAAIGLIILTMLALGIGLAFGRAPLERSCGGDSCSGDCRSCDRIGRSGAP